MTARVITPHEQLPQMPRIARSVHKLAVPIVLSWIGLVVVLTMFVPDLEQVGTTIGLGLLFDTLIVRSFMMPSVAALMGRWFWWPQPVRTRPASQMLRSYGPPSALRAYMLPRDPTDPRGPRACESRNGDAPSTDRFPAASAPHY